jgi:hypothetical protein
MGMLACSSEPTRISDVPVLELEGMSLEKNAAGTDSVVHLSLKYTDGNGDIGLTDADTLPPFDLGSPYNHNLPIKIYYSKSGMFYELKDSVSQEWIVFHERVPVLTPSGKNKTITGIITVHIPANPLNLKPEELKFEVNLIDRALNISNTIETDPIELTH